jgi:hypothetical protein
MNAAINPLYSYTRNQRASLFPVGQADQEIIDSMKLGMVPLRRYARRQTQVAMPAWAQMSSRALAATA